MDILSSHLQPALHLLAYLNATRTSSASLSTSSIHTEARGQNEKTAKLVRFNIQPAERLGDGGGRAGVKGARKSLTFRLIFCVEEVEGNIQLNAMKKRGEEATNLTYFDLGA